MRPPILQFQGKKTKLQIPWGFQRKVWAYVFIALPFLYFLTVNFGAMLAAFSYSFQDYNTMSTKHTFVGLANYLTIFNDNTFLQALKNTLLVAVVRVPVLMVLSLGVALLLTSIKHFKGFFRMLYFIPFVTSGVAISWIFKFMYLPSFGIFTAWFDFLGIPRVNFLGDPKTALASIIAVTIWANVGFYTIIFLAGLEDIPTEFYEAAMIDGAGSWQRFRSITIPLLNRTLVMAAVLCTIASLQTFTMVRMMSVDGYGGPLGSSRTLPMLIYLEAFSSFRMGRASAISVIFFAIVLTLSYIQQKVLTKEVEYG